MFFFTYTAAILAILFAASAAFLLWKYRDNLLTFVFALALTMSALWIGGNAAADVAHTFSLHLFWAGMAWIGAVFLLSFFVIFVDVFIDKKLPPLWRMGAFLFPSLATSLFAFSDTYYITDAVFPAGAPVESTPGILFEMFIPLFVLATLYGFTRLLLFYFQSNGRPRQQAIYIILGFAGLFIGQITFNVLLPLTGELRFFNVGPQFSLILFAASAYAIFRHNLLPVRTFVQRSLVFSILFALIITVYSGILLLLQWYLSLTTDVAAPISAAIVILTGIYGLPYLERFFRRATDHIFFKDTYNYSNVLEKLSETLNTNIELRPLLEQCLETLVQELRIEYAEFKRTSEKLVVRKVAHGAYNKGVGLYLPVCLGSEEIGGLRLGEKRSGDPYSPEDISLLRTFASQAAVSIKKADLYNELKEYSIGLEHKVQERTKYLEEVQSAQKQMINDISHAFQTPLSIIKTTAELLLQTGKDEAAKDRLMTINKSVDHLSKLVTNLLRLATMDIEESGAEKTDVNLSATTQEVVDYASVICQESDIELTTAIEPNIHILAARAHIDELITNLLSNAVKYTRECPQKHIHVELSSCGEFAKLTVNDTGMGINPEELPRVFDRFYRGKTQDGVTQGTGLGLAICGEIAKRHGGRLYAESEGLGKGTTFTLLIPLLRTE